MKIFVLLCVVQGCIGAAIVGERAVCNDVCPQYISQVCGTDGKTYSNLCYLNSEKCHDSTIQLAYEGPCSSTPNGGLSICPALGCFALYDPVCGTDGKTYSNSCELRVQHCHGEVTVAHHGACTGDGMVVS